MASEAAILCAWGPPHADEIHSPEGVLLLVDDDSAAWVVWGDCPADTDHSDEMWPTVCTVWGHNFTTPEALEILAESEAGTIRAECDNMEMRRVIE